MRVALLLCLVGMLLVPAAVTATAINWSEVAVNEDPGNASYVRHFIDPGAQGLDPFNFSMGLAGPFIAIFGYWTFAIVWFAYLARCWMKSGDVIIPIVVGIGSAGIMGTMMPAEGQFVAAVMIAVAVTAAVVRVYVSRIG
jgi:hypothetical protein